MLASVVCAQMAGVSCRPHMELFRVSNILENFLPDFAAAARPTLC